MTIIYKNNLLNESYELGGIKNISQGWRLVSFVCNRMNWNFDMFIHDSTIESKK